MIPLKEKIKMKIGEVFVVLTGIAILFLLYWKIHQAICYPEL